MSKNHQKKLKTDKVVENQSKKLKTVTKPQIMSKNC